jgi:hypothetical protein
MGEYYTGSQARAADAARWVAMGEHYADNAE